MNMQKNILCSVSKQHNLQQGVVLFIALIALVVMSLAAVGLIRSVDTGVMVAGNLTYKQSATTAADNGLETAIGWLGAVVNTATLDADIPAQGYYADQTRDPTNAADISWTNADSRLATGTNIAAGKDESGNNIRYIIQRMCQGGGTPDLDNCLFTSPKEDTGSHDPNKPPPPKIGNEDSPVYRITARVVGAKNTISFIQAFIY